MNVVALFDPWKGPLCTCPKKYSLSPYTGCAHACRYCYISAYIPRAFNSRIKNNFLAMLRRDLQHINPEIYIFMANSSDPYTPPEYEVKLTRQTLQLLLGAGLKVQLVTKSDLVLRDIDLIRLGNCSVSMTITTLDESISHKLEPNAPLPNKRLEAIRRLTEEGVPCSVRIDPIIPWINDYDLDKLVKAIAEAGAKHVVASTYKAKRDNFNRVVQAFPELGEKLTQVYWIEGENLGRARYLDRKFRSDILSYLREVVEDYGMTYATCREGLIRLHNAETCDGSHLIPIRRDHLHLSLGPLREKAPIENASTNATEMGTGRDTTSLAEE